MEMFLVVIGFQRFIGIVVGLIELLSTKDAEQKPLPVILLKYLQALLLSYFKISLFFLH